MNILIIGASRGIGRQLLDQALTFGHTVTVLARHPDKLAPRDRLKIVKGDIRDANSVAQAMAGQEAVCCTIGITVPGLRVTVFSEGTKNFLQAMRRSGVKRLECVTGIGAGDSRGHGGFLYDYLILPTALRTVYADKNRQESLIRASDAEWTIVRPGFLTNGPLTKNYQVLTKLTGITAGKISRADVAHFMLKELKAKKYLRQTPLLTY